MNASIRKESLSDRQPVAGPSRTSTLDVDALATPPDALALYSRDANEFFAHALDRTGASIEQLQPDLNKLVDLISVELLAAWDKQESLCYYLLALDEVVSDRLSGSALVEWTRRTCRAGGDVIDDEDRVEGEGEAGAALSTAKGKGKAVELPAGARWKDKSRQMREQFAKSVADADKICRLYTPFGSFANFPRGNAMPIVSVSAQRDWTTVLRWLCHLGPRGAQLDPIPTHDKVKELTLVLTERAENEMLRKMRDGRFGPHHLKKAKKTMEADWPDLEHRYGPLSLPPPAPEADHICSPYRPVATAAAQGPPSTTAAAASSSSTRLAASAGAATAAGSACDALSQLGAASAPPAKSSADQAKAPAPGKKSHGRAPLQPLPAAAAAATSSSDDERDGSASKAEQEQQDGASQGERAKLRPSPGAAASRRKGRVPRRAAAAAATTSSDDERDGLASEAEQEQQDGASEGECAKLRPSPGAAASRGKGQAPRGVVVVVESSSSSDDEQGSASSEDEGVRTESGLERLDRDASLGKVRAPRRAGIVAHTSSSEDERQRSPSDDGEREQDDESYGGGAEMEPTYADSLCKVPHVHAAAAAAPSTSTSARTDKRAAVPGFVVLGGSTARGAPRASGDVVARGARRAGNGVESSGGQGGVGGDKVGDPSSTGKVGEPSTVHVHDDDAVRTGSRFDQDYLKMPRISGYVRSKPNEPYSPAHEDYVSLPKFADPRLLELGHLKAVIADIPPEQRDNIPDVVSKILGGFLWHRDRLRLPHLRAQTQLTDDMSRSDLRLLVALQQEQGALVVDALCAAAQHDLSDRIFYSKDQRGLREAMRSQGLRLPIRNGHGNIIGWRDRDGLVYDAKEGGEPSLNPFFSFDDRDEAPSSSSADHDQANAHTAAADGWDVRAPWFVSDDEDDQAPLDSTDQSLEEQDNDDSAPDQDDDDSAPEQDDDDSAPEQDDDDDEALELAADQVLEQQQDDEQGHDEPSFEQDAEDETSLNSIVSDSVARATSSGTDDDDEDGEASPRLAVIDSLEAHAAASERRRDYDDDQDDELALVSNVDDSLEGVDDSLEVVEDSLGLGVAGSSRRQQNDERAVQVAPSVVMSDEEDAESEAEAAPVAAAEEPEEEACEGARRRVPTRRRARSRIPVAPVVAARATGFSANEEDDGDAPSLMRERDGGRWGDEQEA